MKVRVQHSTHFASKLVGCCRDLKAQSGVGLQQQARGFDHYRKNFPHLAQATAWEKADQIRVALTIDLAGLQSFNHRMADEYRTEA